MRLWLPRPALRVRIFTAVILALSAVLLFRGLRQGMAFSARPNDFAAYHQAAHAVLRGDLVPSYSGERPYQYPPTLAVLIAPLGLLPARLAAALWTLGSLAVLLWAFRAAGDALGPPVATTAKFLGFLLVFRMAESDFSNGNSNTLVLGLLFLGFALVRNGRAGAGGGLLGLAAAVKLTPLLLLPFLLRRRRRRMAIGFVAGVAVGGIAFPALVLGPVAYARALGAFYEVTLSPLNAAGPAYRDDPGGGYLPGQSLRSLLHRLFRGIDATAHDESTVRVNLLELPKAAVDAMYLSLGAGLLGFLLWRFRGACVEWSGTEIGAVVAAMALLSPLSRKAHFVILFPAAVAAFAALRAAPPHRKRLYALLWWTAFALSALTAPGLIGRAASSYLLAFCPLGLAAGLLIALCVAAKEE